MLKRFCDLCGAEICIVNAFNCDSKTQFYKLVKDDDIETDICIACMHKIIKVVNRE